jgi:hypothetical protein
MQQQSKQGNLQAPPGETISVVRYEERQPSAQHHDSRDWNCSFNRGRFLDWNWNL